MRPTHGLFLTRDPVEGVWERSASRNGYAYVEGNPTNWVDLSGKQACPFGYQPNGKGECVLIGGDNSSIVRASGTPDPIIIKVDFSQQFFDSLRLNRVRQQIQWSHVQAFIGSCIAIGKQSLENWKHYGGGLLFQVPQWIINALRIGSVGLNLLESQASVPRAAKLWKCTAQCNLEGSSSHCWNKRVEGVGVGSSEVEACTTAKRAATQSAPAGCYARHCKCTCSRG